MLGPGESQPEEEPLLYAVRISVQADQDVIEAMLHLVDVTDNPEKGREWKSGLYAYVRTLSTFPRRHPVEPTQTRRFQLEIRQSLYRHGGSGSVGYHVLFTVEDAGSDGPIVRVVHIRHAARRPPTREEACRILANQ